VTRRPAIRDDTGMATAELAASLPVLMIILAVALAAVSISGARVRAQDAAGLAARAAARGDQADGRRLFDQTAADGSDLDVTVTATDVTATVRTVVRPLGGWLGSYTIVERAVAAPEPQVDGASP
jgi:Flp pilus assembly protein TadG